MQTYWPVPYTKRNLRVAFARGEYATIGVDWSGLGTVVTSVWSGLERRVRFGAESLLDGVSSVLLKNLVTGVEDVQNTATFSDGQVRVQRFEIQIGRGELFTASCPVLVAPADEAQLTDPSEVSLEWTDPEGQTFDLYIWRTSDSPPVSPSYSGVTTPYSVSGLDGATEYSWYVAGSGGEGCEVRQFQFTTADPVPACPMLTSPDDGSVTTESTVTLEWSSVPYATSYRVYLSANGAPLALASTTASTSYEVTGIVSGDVYIWSITALNGTGESSGCGSRSFSRIGVTIYDTPGSYTFTPNPLAVSIEVRVLGGGGGAGGGAVENGAGITGGGAGGGAAGVVQTFTPAEVVGPITITVGSGGAGGSGVSNASGTDGSAGQASSFGALLVAGGGGGGYRGQKSGDPGRISGGGGGGGVPNSGSNGGVANGGTGGTTGGGVGGGATPNATNGSAPSTIYGGSGGGSGGRANTYTGGTASLWGGVGGGSGGTGINGVSLTPGANGTISTGATDIPQGGAVTTNGPIVGDGQNGVNPVDQLLLAGSSGAGGGGSPSQVAGFNTGQGGSGGKGGRGSGGGGGGSSYSSFGVGGGGGAGGDGYVVVIERFAP